MEPFEGVDFFDIESLLTEEEIMIRDMVRDWVDEEVIPRFSVFSTFICLIDKTSPEDLYILSRAFSKFSIFTYISLTLLCIILVSEIAIAT